MSTPVAVLDANVLYGIELTDLFLSLATSRLVRVHWSNQILTEVKRNLAKRHDLSKTAIDRRIAMMNAALPGALDDAPATLVDEMTNDPADRHVLALGAHVEASHLISHNLRHFPETACKPFGIEPTDPDRFLAAIAAQHPRSVLATIAEMAARRRRPPMTTDQLLERLRRPAPAFVAQLRASPS